MSKQLTDYRLKQRDYLLKIARAMNARLDLPNVLELVIRYAVEMTNGQAGVIALRKDDERFEVAASYRLEEKYVHHLQPMLDHVSLGMPISRHTPESWQQSEEVQSEVQQLARRLPDQLDQTITLPLVNQGELRGVLFIFRSEGAALFTPLDRNVLAAFTDQAAVAIQNARLYGTLSEHARELRLLYDFSVQMAGTSQLEAALKVAATYAVAIGPSDWAAILTYDPNGEQATQYVCYPETFVLLDAEKRVNLEIESRLLLHEEEATFFGNASDHDELPSFFQEQGFQNALAVPIVGASHPLGVLWVASSSTDTYSADTARLLLTLKHYLGLTLDKFTLIERLEARERQLSTIIEHTPAGVLLLDKAGRVLLQNPIAHALTGSPQTEQPHLSDILRLEDEGGLAVALPLPNGQESITVRGYLRGTGESRMPFLQVSLTSLIGSGQGNKASIEGYVANVVDLSALKEAEHAKRAFLAGLSHELKTPLALIRGYAETLRYPQVREDTPLYEEALDVILDETAHLTNMVNQMLMAARLEAGALALEWDEIAIGPFLEKVVEPFRHAYPKHNWQLSYPPALPTITGDPSRLREVFQNLLSNAAKYSAPGTTVHVSAKSTPTSVQISVQDTGIGISKSAQKRLFERFYRASNHAEGTGLGLYMSKALVEAHQGTIEVVSEEGEGSTFTVKLPTTWQESKT